MFFSKINWFPPVQQSINAQKYPKIAKKRKILPVFSVPKTKNAKNGKITFFPKNSMYFDKLLKIRCFLNNFVSFYDCFKYSHTPSFLYKFCDFSVTYPY